MMRGTGTGSAPAEVATSGSHRLAARSALRRAWEPWLPTTVAAVTVLVSAILAAMLWLVHDSVQRAYLRVAQGEGSALLEATHAMLRGLGRRPDPSDVEALLERERARGLRYVAVLPPGGVAAPRLEAGEPIGGSGDPQGLSPAEPIAIGDRVRLVGGPPARPGYAPHVRPPGEPAAPPEARPPPRIVLEFEPVEARQLAETARRSLVAGLFVVPLVLAAGLFLTYVVRQREELARRLEHERRLAALGEMTAVIAHEIRNPLASLKGHAQLLSRSLAGDERLAKAELVVREGVRLQELVNDLLEFARSGEIDPAPANPAAVLREAADAVSDRRIAVDDRGAPSTWPLDAMRMRQVLANLMRNAVQASPEGEPVVASVFRDGGRLVFEVRDRGPGIAAGDEARIFEPFFTRKTRGTGLGLPLARRIVELHGGTIEARNDPTGGAIFRVSLARG